MKMSTNCCCRGQLAGWSGQPGQDQGGEWVSAVDFQPMPMMMVAREKTEHAFNINFHQIAAAAAASCMWHEKAAAGNIFRQPQIILHVCARTLTSGQEVEATTKTGEGSWGEGEREGDWSGSPSESSWDIIIFVSLLTLKRNLCSVIIIRLC